MTALVALAGCQKEEKAPTGGKRAEPQMHGAIAGAPDASTVAAAPAAPAPKPPEPNVVTVLITGDENGFLLPTEGKGGAAELLGKWRADENHCAPASAECAKSGTLAVSTGDHWGGPSISSFFFGEPTAEALRHLGYAASGFGNHELDFGNEQFLKNKETGGFPYVAANVKVKPNGPAAQMQMPAHVLVERNGHKIAVIGLTDLRAGKTTMSGRFEGLELTPYEQALTEAVPAAWKDGADAVVVVSDVCPSDLEPVLAKHADWKLAVVAGGGCLQKLEKKSGSTWLVSPGRHFQSYARAKLIFDPAKPAGEKLKTVDGSVVANEGGTPDSALARVLQTWKEKNDKALGEQIGFTRTGLAMDSPELHRWITRAIRANLKTDVALVNKKGIRQPLPAGVITKGSVYTVIPFENSVMILDLKGADLKKALEHESALFAGFTKGPKGFVDNGGRALDPKKTYTVATVEYLYFGGDGFEFEKQDEDPMQTGQVWQTPVIAWTKEQGSSEEKPLERMLK